MKRLAAVAVALFLAGCAPGDPVKPVQEGGDTGGLSVVRVIVNGSPLTCIVSNHRGISCDWDRRYA